MRRGKERKTGSRRWGVRGEEGKGEKGRRGEGKRKKNRGGEGKKEVERVWGKR